MSRIQTFLRTCIIGAATLSSLSPALALAQTQTTPVHLTGHVVDAEEEFGIEGVNVIARPVADSTRFTGLITDREGQFNLLVRWKGATRLRISFVGYRAIEKVVEVADEDIDLGRFDLEIEPIQLEGVEVAARQDRITVSGDTLGFNADGFTVHEDATVDGLVEKLPGFSLEDGQVMYNGEPIGAVTLDGREFFGQEALTALQALPAEMIKSIQVYDKLSEQAEFTGFDDGNGVKAINLQTKEGKKNGAFGKANAGYGSDERYQGGLSLNVFNGERRLSINGSSSNSDGGRGRGGWGGRGGGGGISQTHRLNVNLNDKWMDAIEVDAGYFMRANDSRGSDQLTRDYFLDDGVSQRYEESNTSNSSGLSHTFYGRMEYQVNERNKLHFRPRLSFNSSESSSNLDGTTTRGSLSDLSRLLTNTTSESNSLSGNMWASWQHRFEKKGRTISFNAGLGFSGSDSNQKQDATTLGDDVEDMESARSYLKDNTGDNTDWEGRITYTEPLGEHQQFEIHYEPSVEYDRSDRITQDLLDDGSLGGIDSTLSSRYHTDEFTQEAGISLRHSNDKLNISGSVDLESVRLTGSEVFPDLYNVDKTYLSVLPNARIRYKFSETHQFRLDYRARSNTPSSSQLRSVVDNSNPLHLSTGNPGLQSGTSHSLFLRDSWTGKESGRSVSFWARGSISRNRISRITYYAPDEDRIVNGIQIPRDGQLTIPVNLNGAWSVSANGSFTRPLDLIKSNLTLESGYGYSSDPGLVEETKYTTRVHRLSGEFRITSNVSEKVDFRLSESSSYNIVNSELQTRQQSNYLRHRGSASFRVGPYKGITAHSSFSLNRYNRLGSSLDTASEDWDAGITYRLPHLESVRFEITMKDILDSGNNISQSENAQYVQSSASSVLGRHMLFVLRYELREFRP